MNSLTFLLLASFAFFVALVARALLVATEPIYRSENCSINSAKRHRNRRYGKDFQHRQLPLDYACRVEYTSKSRAEQAHNNHK
jgi:hypothetical protein